jgi:hypothetical protein
MSNLKLPLLVATLALSSFVLAREPREKEEKKDKHDHAEHKDEKKDKSDRERPVPDTAQLVMEGRDKELSYLAKAEGTAYLYDASHDKLIETFNLNAEDRLTISPKSNAMAVNGKTISRDIELDRKVTYRLLYDVKQK